jgi:hypothetical protein
LSADVQAGRGTLAEHRARLAELGHVLRARTGAKESREAFRTLSEQLFRARHGASRDTHGRLAAAERAQREGTQHTKVRRSLAEVGRRLRRERADEGSVRDRFDRAVATTRYERALYEGRSGGEASVELESKLTDPIIRLLRMRRRGEGGGPIRDLLRNRHLERPSKLGRWGRRRRERRRARLEAELYAAAESLIPGELTEDQQRARDGLDKMQLEERYDQALLQVEAYARERGVRPGRLSWDEVGDALGIDTQRDLLVGALALRADFARDRSLPLVEMAREPRSVELVTPVTIAGQRFERGTQRLPPLFGRTAEYKSVWSVKDTSGVELHRRVRGRAGQASTDSFHFMWSLDSSMFHQHVHVPFDRRMHRLDRPGATEALVDHWRRASLVGELLDARHFGRLTRRERDDQILRDYSSGTHVADLYGHLSGQRELFRTGALKASTIGYRVKMYRDADGLVNPHLDGYEVRIVRASRPDVPERRNVRERWLDAIQRTLASGDYGLPRSSWRRWMATRLPEEPGARGDALAALHYNRSDVLETAPKELLDMLTPALRDKLEAHGSEDYALRMLVHDWSRDSLWLALPEARRAAAQAEIRRAQRRALAKLRNGNPSHEVVREFASTSGLLEHAARSLGM